MSNICAHGQITVISFSSGLVAPEPLLVQFGRLSDEIIINDARLNVGFFQRFTQLLAIKQDPRLEFRLQ